MSYLRNLFTQLLKKVNCQSVHVSIGKLFRFSQLISPSRKFATGGRLFDFWFNLFASPFQMSYMNNIHRPVINPLLSRQLRTVTHHFYFAVLSGLRVSSRKNSYQAFLLSTVFVSKGLSNSGLSFLSKTGLVLPKTTFVIQRKEKLSSLNQQLLAQGRSTLSVHWVDNFSKYYNRSIFKVTRSNTIFQNASVHAFTTTSLPQQLLQIDDPTLQCVSGEWFCDSFKQSVLDFYNNLCSSSVWTRRYWSSNIIKMLIYDVPIPENRPGSSTSSLDNFFPYKVYKHNISSTKGLLKVFTEIQKNFFLQRFYLPVKVDVTIYYQWHRLFFCESFKLQPDFQFITVLLAPWHTFKHSCDVIWRKYFNFIFAPFLLFSDKTVSPRYKPRLTTIHSIFSYFLLAYGSLEAEFLTLRVYLEDFFPDSPYLIILYNIIDLFEIYLPVVYSYYYNFNSNDFEQTHDSMLQILQVFFSLCSKKDSYPSSIILNLSQLFYLKQKNHPILKLLHQDFLSFSEEVGEISLSLLAKSVMTDNLKGSIKHLNQNYQELLLVRTVVEQVGHEQFLSNRKISRFERLKKIKPQSEEVLQVVSFFDEIITDLEFQIFVSFAPSTKFIKPTKPPKKDFHPQQRFFCEDPNTAFDMEYSRVVRLFSKIKYKPDVHQALNKLSMTTSSLASST